jgi:hypothetical protein
MKTERTIDITPDIFGGPGHSKWLRDLLMRTRRRAKRDDIEFTVPSDCAERLYHNQGGRYAVTGIAFRLRTFRRRAGQTSVRAEH